MAQFVYPPVTVDTAGLATEATLQQVETNTADTVSQLQTANTTLTSIDGKDFATETTLAGVESELQAANTTLTSLDGKDFATQTTLADALTELQGINSNTFATEPTLDSVKTASEDSLVELQALNTRLAGSLAPVAHDELVITYVVAGNGQGEISTVVYKLATATVATLTMSYDGNDRLSGVVRS